MTKNGLRLLMRSNVGPWSQPMNRRLSSCNDAQQKKYLKEPCILVDEKDEEVGTATKLACHTWDNIKAGGQLHRAFSVFMFNDKKELLLQKRAAGKITFPGVWTNTCCSHPLYIEAERETKNAIGIKRAAQRKLNHELGFTPDQVPIEDMICTARILYQAQSDEKWGEHELDYCLIIKSNEKANPNPNEVEDVEYVDPVILREMLGAPSILVSPWFRLIAKDLLWKWWENLDSINTDSFGKNILKFDS